MKKNISILANDPAIRKIIDYILTEEKLDKHFMLSIFPVVL